MSQVKLPKNGSVKLQPYRPSYFERYRRRRDWLDWATPVLVIGLVVGSWLVVLCVIGGLAYLLILLVQAIARIVGGH